MSSYVSADLRRAVIARAGGLCEYCLIHEADAWQIDHVISEKHGRFPSLEAAARIS